jgi:hypothetical protein
MVCACQSQFILRMNDPRAGWQQQHQANNQHADQTEQSQDPSKGQGSMVVLASDQAM